MCSTTTPNWLSLHKGIRVITTGGGGRNPILATVPVQNPRIDPLGALATIAFVLQRRRRPEEASTNWEPHDLSWGLASASGPSGKPVCPCEGEHPSTNSPSAFTAPVYAAARGKSAPLPAPSWSTPIMGGECAGGTVASPSRKCRSTGSGERRPGKVDVPEVLAAVVNSAPPRGDDLLGRRPACTCCRCCCDWSGTADRPKPPSDYEMSFTRRRSCGRTSFVLLSFGRPFAAAALARGTATVCCSISILPPPTSPLTKS